MDSDTKYEYYDLVDHETTINEFNELLNNKENSIKIEHSIFNYTKDYILDNHMTTDLFTNIYNYKKNTLLTADVDYNNLSVDLNVIAYLKPNELKPECFIDIQNKINKRNEKKNHIEYSDVYICKRCHQKKCTSSVVVTRGLDENLTTLITCHNCGNVFSV